MNPGCFRDTLNPVGTKPTSPSGFLSGFINRGRFQDPFRGSPPGAIFPHRYIAATATSDGQMPTFAGQSPGNADDSSLPVVPPSPAYASNHQDTAVPPTAPVSMPTPGYDPGFASAKTFALPNGQPSMGVDVWGPDSVNQDCNKQPANTTLCPTPDAAPHRTELVEPDSVWYKDPQETSPGQARPEHDRSGRMSLDGFWYEDPDAEVGALQGKCCDKRTGGAGEQEEQTGHAKAVA